MYSWPGAPGGVGRIGAYVTYGGKELIRAALFVRQNGPLYLKALSVDHICSLLTDFVSSNYWLLADETQFEDFDGSFADHVSAETKASLSNALADSTIFRPSNKLTLFPLVPVRVESDFDSEPFFLIQAMSFVGSRLPQNTDVRSIDPTSFPPHKDWKGRFESPNAWLGVRAPVLESSEKMKAAILGALALTPLPIYRHMFSHRAMFGGRCTFTGEGSSMSLGDAHTPPMMHDIVISENDHNWLNTLASKLMRNDRSTRRQLRALEYFFRAWGLGPSERFPILCMALDAILGEASHTSQAIVDGVRELLGTHINDGRLRQLMGLRGSVIHGGAPDVYDSRKYDRYYETFGADPIHDLELVVGSCLRKRIFGATLKEHADPNARFVEEAQKKGRIPKQVRSFSILDCNPDADNSHASDEVSRPLNRRIHPTKLARLLLKRLMQWLP